MRSNSFDICKAIKRIEALGLILPVLGSATGCGASSVDIPIGSGAKQAGAGSATMKIEVPTQIPNILVDQTGYDTDSEKVAVFRGENLPDIFYVCEVDSGDIVYTGEILKSVYNEELGEYNSHGYFTDLKKPGRYYIYSDATGDSYSFEIKNDIYDEVFNEACKKYYVNRCGIGLSERYAGERSRSACHTTMAKLQENPGTMIDVSGGWHMDGKAGRDTVMGCSIIENLLLAFEMNPSAFTDNADIPESGNGIPDILDEIKYEMDWLLKMQDPKTGGEYGAALTDAASDVDSFTAAVNVTPVDLEATISFASAAARFSFFYQQYDPDFATICIKASDRAWRCFLNNQKAEEDTAAFKAAASLYRATGSQEYHQVMQDYFDRDNLEELFVRDENIFIGAVTYLSIKHQVDVGVCTRLMKCLMKRAEEIAQKASTAGYLTTISKDDKAFSKMMDEMRCLTITDHIIYNHEYTTIIENHAHYLMGMNPEAVNYITDDTERTYETAGTSSLLSNPVNTSLFIFMISVLENKA